ncbi:MAG: hypothetical protein N3A54_01080 [Patescibacteria group bacterium]|nr:hypothetical protein [Patescibacteria group bacterium]
MINWKFLFENDNPEDLPNEYQDDEWLKNIFKEIEKEERERKYNEYLAHKFKKNHIYRADLTKPVGFGFVNISNGRIYLLNEENYTKQFIKYLNDIKDSKIVDIDSITDYDFGSDVAGLYDGDDDDEPSSGVPGKSESEPKQPRKDFSSGETSRKPSVKTSRKRKEEEECDGGFCYSANSLFDVALFAASKFGKGSLKNYKRENVIDYFKDLIYIGAFNFSFYKGLFFVYFFDKKFNKWVLYFFSDKDNILSHKNFDQKLIKAYNKIVDLVKTKIFDIKFQAKEPFGLPDYIVVAISYYINYFGMAENFVEEFPIVLRDQINRHNEDETENKFVDKGDFENYLIFGIIKPNNEYIIADPEIYHTIYDIIPKTYHDDFDKFYDDGYIVFALDSFYLALFFNEKTLKNTHASEMGKRIYDVVKLFDQKIVKHIIDEYDIKIDSIYKVSISDIEKFHDDIEYTSFTIEEESMIFFKTYGLKEIIKMLVYYKFYADVDLDEKELQYLDPESLERYWNDRGLSSKEVVDKEERKRLEQHKKEREKKILKREELKKKEKEKERYVKQKEEEYYKEFLDYANRMILFGRYIPYNMEYIIYTPDKAKNAYGIDYGYMHDYNNRGNVIFIDVFKTGLSSGFFYFDVAKNDPKTLNIYISNRSRKRNYGLKTLTVIFKEIIEGVLNKANIEQVVFYDENKKMVSKEPFVLDKGWEKNLSSYIDNLRKI